MSGGHFDHAYGRVQDFAETLQNELDNIGQCNRYGETHCSWEKPETIAALREIEREAFRLAKRMREAEWLYSGDTSEESFLSRITEHEKERHISRNSNRICTAMGETTVTEQSISKELELFVRLVRSKILRDVARELYELGGEQYIYAARYVEDRADEVENGK